MNIGILSLQGAVEPHKRKLEALGATATEVRHARDLKDLAGIILPGGESTAMIHLLRTNKLWEPLKEFVKYRATLGVCAGAILLAKQVSSPHQPSLEAMDIEIERNAFGRQIDSFIDWCDPTLGSPFERTEGVFIRAPRIRSLNGCARPLLLWRDEPVLVEEENLIVSTFHPELTDSATIHAYFLTKAKHTNG